MAVTYWDSVTFIYVFSWSIGNLNSGRRTIVAFHSVYRIPPRKKLALRMHYGVCLVYSVEHGSNRTVYTFCWRGSLFIKQVPERPPAGRASTDTEAVDGRGNQWCTNRTGWLTGLTYRRRKTIEPMKNDLKNSPDQIWCVYERVS